MKLSISKDYHISYIERYTSIHKCYAKNAVPIYRSSNFVILCVR